MNIYDMVAGTVVHHICGIAVSPYLSRVCYPFVQFCTYDTALQRTHPDIGTPILAPYLILYKAELCADNINKIAACVP